MSITIYWNDIRIETDTPLEAAAVILALPPPGLPAPAAPQLPPHVEEVDGEVEGIVQSDHDKLGDAIMEALNAAGEPLTRTGIMKRVLGRIPSGAEAKKVNPFINSGELRRVDGGRDLYEIARE